VVADRKVNTTLPAGIRQAAEAVFRPVKFAQVELRHSDAVAGYGKGTSTARQILKIAVPVMARDGW
jgi:hypothetical protein